MALWEWAQLPWKHLRRLPQATPNCLPTGGGLAPGDERLPRLAWALLWTLQSGGALGRNQEAVSGWWGRVRCSWEQNGPGQVGWAPGPPYRTPEGHCVLLILVSLASA